MSETTTSKVDLERILRRLDDLSQISEDGKGVTRLAYTDLESEAIDYVRSELPDEVTTRVDSIGNFFATPDPDAPKTVCIGSHLDSVFNGGRLDGALGVVLALETLDVVTEMNEDPEDPLTIVVFRGEESARFGIHTIGSRGALGMLTVDDFSKTDQNDIPLWHAMQRQGVQPSDLSESTINTDRVDRFYEVHIEQGRILDESDDKLGLVTSVRAPVRYEVTVEGAYDHSGATPMELRKDALVAAGEMITDVEDVAKRRENVVATVGDISAHDGAINKVCGRVTFPLDIRSEILDMRDDTEEEVLEAFVETAEHRDIGIDTKEIDRSTPMELDKEAIDELEAGARDLGIAHRRMPSGGGHDAMNLQKVGIPTGLMFVPSVDGISHSPAEETDHESVEAAAKVLLRAAMSS